MNPKALQEYLKTNSPESLTEKLGIAVKYSDDNKLVLFNYNQIESPKTDPLVRCSRGTILENNTWNLVSFSFYRFLNYGENGEEKIFNWNNFSTMEKVDGSMITLYFYDGKWNVQTRGTIFANCNISFYDFTFDTLFRKTFGDKYTLLDKDSTYTFELCSIYNKVVREYKTPQLFLLSSFDKNTMEELSNDELLEVSKMLDIPTPIVYNFNGYKEIEAFLLDQSVKDPTFEGVVVKDDKGIRLKIKSLSYLKLHRLSGNGEIYNLNNIVPLIMIGESEEIFAYFKEIKPFWDKISGKIEEYKQEVSSVWEQNKHLTDQKEFAMKVKDCRFSSCLFTMKKTGKNLQEIFLPEDAGNRERMFSSIVKWLKQDGMDKVTL